MRDNTLRPHFLIPLLVCGLPMFSYGGISWHSCVILNWGATQCWGANDALQLGNGGVGETCNGQLCKATPVEPTGLNDGVVAISLGELFSCAITKGGALKCWGQNMFGQLGIGSYGNAQSLPVDISGLSSGVAAVSCGGGHTCVILSSGPVKCWGYNDESQVGNGCVGETCFASSLGGWDALCRKSPTDVVGLNNGVVSVAAGGWHTCALMADGTLKCWGWNDAGQLGIDSRSDMHTPAKVPGLSQIHMFKRDLLPSPYPRLAWSSPTRLSLHSLPCFTAAIVFFSVDSWHCMFNFYCAAS
jgi:hypothetical protein